MDYKIISDSSFEMNSEIKDSMNIELVAFKIALEGENYIDNEELDMDKFLNQMKKSKDPVKTACPSPGDFLEAYKDSENIFVVTISSKLSGSYNSALLAKQMLDNKDKDKFIHVFDSKSASIGQNLVVFKIKELIDKGYESKKIVKEVEEFISNMETLFILESLDNLIKNGRITKTKGLLASALKFRPIMQGNKGEIELYENIRGDKKSLNRLVEVIGEKPNNFEDRILCISHNKAYEKAEFLKEKIGKKYNFKEIQIYETGGLSSSYADLGGIILAY